MKFIQHVVEFEYGQKFQKFLVLFSFNIERKVNKWRKS